MLAARAIDSSDSPHSMPGSQLLQLLALARDLGVDTADVLEGTGQSERALEEPNARVSLETMNLAVARTRALSGEPALGVLLGLRRRPAMYGFLGFGAMSARSLREALELSLRFASTVSTGIALDLIVADGRAALRVEERVDIGELRDVAVFALMIGLAQMGKALTGRGWKRAELQFALPRPSYCDRFPEVFGRARFDQPATQLVFDARCLEWPVVTADRTSFALSRRQCELAFPEHGFDFMLVARVRRLISRPEGVRSLPEVATHLRMSGRTLKRRLAGQGVSFSGLLDQERQRRAQLLLAMPQLSLRAISERLGYSSFPNFARAFRRWTGQTPAAYRRAHAAQAKARVAPADPSLRADAVSRQ